MLQKFDQAKGPKRRAGRQERSEAERPTDRTRLKGPKAWAFWRNIRGGNAKKNYC